MTPDYVAGWLVGALLGLEELFALIAGDSTARLAVIVVVVALGFLLQLGYLAWRAVEQVRGIPQPPKDWQKRNAGV